MMFHNMNSSNIFHNCHKSKKIEKNKKLSHLGIIFKTKRNGCLTEKKMYAFK